MFVSTNGTLYGGDGPNGTTNFANLFALTQNASKTFDPTDSTTYTKQFDSSSTAPITGFPFGYRVRCITQLGNNLMTGTFIGTVGLGVDVIQASSSANVEKFADIFPWDRVSATYNLPIRLYEQGINSMIMVNNQLYISAGQFGRFYVYNGYLAQKLLEFPHDTTALLTNPYNPNTVYPDAMKYIRGRLFFGITGGSSSIGPSGVYSVNLDGTGLCMDNTTDQGNTDNRVFIGSIFPLFDFNQGYTLGFSDTTANVKSIDVIDVTNSYSTDYSSFADTQWYEVGELLKPNTSQTVRLNLDKKLASGDSVRISYRLDKSDSFTTLATLSTVGSAEFQFPSAITSRKVQFRVALAKNPRVQLITIE
jgi:hypothetical protein